MNETHEIRVGDYVQLTVRESPFVDDPNSWWKVYQIDDLGLHVRLYSKEGFMVSERFGVSPLNIRGHRKYKR